MGNSEPLARLPIAQSRANTPTICNLTGVGYGYFFGRKGSGMRKGILLLGFAVATLSAIGVLPVPANAGVAPSNFLLMSNSAKVVVLNPVNGAVLSVRPLAQAPVQPLVSNHNFCNSTDACYRTNTPPYANQGFYGTAGTYYGNWPYRNGGYSGQYSARFCWTAACGPTLSPNTTFTFSGGATVTGTSVTIN